MKKTEAIERRSEGPGETDKENDRPLRAAQAADRGHRNPPPLLPSRGVDLFVWRWVSKNKIFFEFFKNISIFFNFFKNN